MPASAACPVCGIAVGDLGALASHLVDRAEASDAAHVMWLNRHATKYRLSASELEPLLATVLAGAGGGTDRVTR